MNTAIQSSPIHVNVNEKQAIKSETRVLETDARWKTAEFNRYGLVPIILVIVVGIGAVCAATVLHESAVKLALITISASFVQAMIIAVMPMRVITIAAAVSVIFNLVIAAL